jgi:hypothetical protein
MTEQNENAYFMCIGCEFNFTNSYGDHVKIAYEEEAEFSSATELFRDLTFPISI